jgi:hypothetical protein
LRSRPIKIDYTGGDNSEEDDEDDADYEETESDLCITISQMKKTRNKDDSVVEAPVMFLPDNSSLACIPFVVNTFGDLYRLAKKCVEEKIMWKDTQKLPLILPTLKKIHDLIGVGLFWTRE